MGKTWYGSLNKNSPEKEIRLFNVLLKHWPNKLRAGLENAEDDHESHLAELEGYAGQLYIFGRFINPVTQKTILEAKREIKKAYDDYLKTLLKYRMLIPREYVPIEPKIRNKEAISDPNIQFNMGENKADAAKTNQMICLCVKIFYYLTGEKPTYDKNYASESECESVDSKMAWESKFWLFLKEISEILEFKPTKSKIQSLIKKEFKRLKDLEPD